MMANAFKTSVPGLEKELEALITDNQIQVLFIILFGQVKITNIHLQPVLNGDAKWVEMISVSHQISPVW